MPGLTRHIREKAWEGYTLFCPTGAEAPGEGQPGHGVYLIDMEGRIVHEWAVRTSVQSYCRLLPTGNLLYPTHARSEVARGNCGLREIDRDGEVLWQYRCRIDHDFQVLENGNFLIHTITDNMCPALGPELKRHPYLIEVTPEKEIVWDFVNPYMSNQSRPSVYRRLRYSPDYAAPLLGG